MDCMVDIVSAHHYLKSVAFYCYNAGIVAPIPHVYKGQSLIFKTCVEWLWKVWYVTIDKFWSCLCELVGKIL